MIQRDTPRVPEYMVSAAIRALSSVPEPIYAVVSGALRREDEALCIWIDEQDNSVLRVSTDVLSEDVAAALDNGRKLAQEAVTLLAIAADVEEVVAETEDDEQQYAIWRP